MILNGAFVVHSTRNPRKCVTSSRHSEFADDIKCYTTLEPFPTAQGLRFGLTALFPSQRSRYDVVSRCTSSCVCFGWICEVLVQTIDCRFSTPKQCCDGKEQATNHNPPPGVQPFLPMLDDLQYRERTFSPMEVKGGEPVYDLHGSGADAFRGISTDVN